MASVRRSRVDYARLADLRYQLRRFLGRREEAARSAGVEPQQYAVLLQLKGLEGRRFTQAIQSPQIVLRQLESPGDG